MRVLVLLVSAAAAVACAPTGQPTGPGARLLKVGRCAPGDQLLHAETIVVNNDGRSRVAGDVRLNVEAPVNLTCARVLDNSEAPAGAHPALLAGGVGHNYLTIGFGAAYGHSLSLYVELYGPK